MTFPISPVPDPNDDGFEEPGCWRCGGWGYRETLEESDDPLYALSVRRDPCDCQREEEDG